MERIAMSQEERDKLEWLKRAQDGKISQREAPGSRLSQSPSPGNGSPRSGRHLVACRGWKKYGAGHFLEGPE